MNRLSITAVVAAAALLAACESNPNDPGDDPCETQRDYTIGQTVSGSLSSSDCILQDNSYIDFYRFTLSTTREVVITQRSDDFDSYLFLFEADGDPIDSDDDGDPLTDLGSQIVVTLSPGTYIIGANSLDANETGTYQLLSN